MPDLSQAEKGRPSLIISRTVIGDGSPNKAGTASAHGEPLGEDEVRLAKERLGWPYKEPFTVPQEAMDHFRVAQVRGRQLQDDRQDRLSAYRKAYPAEAAQLEEALRGELSEGWERGLDNLFGPGDTTSLRQAQGRLFA